MFLRELSDNNGLRRRRIQDDLEDEFALPDERLLPIIYDRYKSSVIPAFSFIIGLILLGLMYYAVFEYDKKLPEPLLIEDELHYPERFIAERAMHHIINFTSLGPRPVGSFENEVLSVNLLSKEINAIIKQAHPIHRISFDIQRVSGSFPLKFLDGMTNVYMNVQNVIARMGPVFKAPHSILLNCHFDTVADSPGGSDDSAGCAIMLEVFRKISLMDKPLLNNIIFLFNGAEENMLQASHGFITQHEWANDIIAFINLEACGAGGKELLFQAGPENPWLLEAYADTVPYPLASSLAQEIFQSGLILGDTDFRIFRDFGNIPGLDFAWATNGYVYHTKFDDGAQIPLGSLQRTGDNILPLTLRLANSVFPDSVQSTGNLVFFDFIGLFIIHLSENVAKVIGYVIVFLSLYTMYQNYRCANTTSNISCSVYVINLLICSLTIFFSAVLALFSSLLIAFVLTHLNRAMSWYATPIWILFLYGIPALLIPLIVIRIVFKKQRKVMVSDWAIHSLFLDGNMLLWILALMVFLKLGLGSGFLPASWLFFSLLANRFKTYYFIETDLKYYFGYLVIMMVPFLQGAYIINGAFQIVVPIMGRSGAGNHCELVLGILSTAIIFLLINFLLPFIVIVKKGSYVINVLTTALSIALLALILTPMGFPYSSNKFLPSHQRYIILHSERSFFTFRGAVARQDSGYWIVDLDVNSPRMILPLVPEMSLIQTVDSCDSHLYCGLPYSIPVLTLLTQTHWIPGPSPIISIPTNLTLVNKEYQKNGVTRFSFIANGPDHISLVLSPKSDVILTSWSFLNSEPLAGPMWGDRTTYFVYYSCASNCTPWSFWLDLKIPFHYVNESVLDVALSGHFIHGAHQASVRFKKMMSQFPPWTVTSGWTAAYRAYLF